MKPALWGSCARVRLASEGSDCRARLLLSSGLEGQNLWVTLAAELQAVSELP